jgi:hypothetical protein
MNHDGLFKGIRKRASTLLWVEALLLVEVAVIQNHTARTLASTEI